MQLFVRAVWCCQEHSAWDILEEIHCPVLVFAAERDEFTPIDCANRVSEAIPQGRLVILAEGSHAALIEQPEIINYHIDRFLEQF
jgi:pimeloyl-ACP methyl ester carboxylesterase